MVSAKHYSEKRGDGKIEFRQTHEKAERRGARKRGGSALKLQKRCRDV